MKSAFQAEKQEHYTNIEQKVFHKLETEVLKDISLKTLDERASALNEAIAIGDWEFYTKFLDNIESVSTEKIQLVAKQYLVEDQSTVGWFIPK